MKRLTAIFGATLAVILFAAAASAQGFYPREWWRGDSGLFTPDYVTPADREPGFLVGDRRGKHGVVFGAAAVDSRCQPEEAPRIQILSPNAGRVTIDLGSFVATRNDAGSTYCIGRVVRGAVIRYKGRPARGETLSLRVRYPAVSGQRAAMTFRHDIPLR